MTHHVNLTHLRKPLYLPSQKMGGDELVGGDHLNIPPGQGIPSPSLASPFEDQGFILNQSGIPYIFHRNASMSDFLSASSVPASNF
jgi:hypothetical protein